MSAQDCGQRQWQGGAVGRRWGGGTTREGWRADCVEPIVSSRLGAPNSAERSALGAASYAATQPTPMPIVASDSGSTQRTAGGLHLAGTTSPNARGERDMCEIMMLRDDASARAEIAAAAELKCAQRQGQLPSLC